jgi:hypothetical protein
MKISMGVVPRQVSGTLLDPKIGQEIFLGCLETLNRLGPQRALVEVIRVSWVELPGINEPVFNLSVHFVDALQNKCSHTIDSRFLATRRPLAEAIPLVLCADDCLPRFISEHLEKCKERIERAQGLIDLLQKK